ncbi:glycoside hydrolase family 127 protein [Echinicola sediminis]
MLERQRDGLSGRLDEVYEVVCGPNNGWLGGTGDSWERGPYWIDGLVPLAYILDDEDLKGKAQKWMDWSLENQRENGYFGPFPFDESKDDYIPGTQQDNSEDWWPKMVMLKALQQYYSATEDERVLDLMTRYFKYQHQMLGSYPLGHFSWWANRRGADNLQVVYWLYNITGDQFLLELGDTLHQQTFDWAGTFYGDQLLQSNPHASFHCVNVAQGLKAPVIHYQKSKEARDLEAPLVGLQKLQANHGFANGMYGGDEGLHGNDPTQGSELCSAVELMYSLESMLPISGNPYYADYLEKVAFNVLPTQHTDDFNQKQYFQQANQIKINHEYRNFYDEHGGSNTVYGVLTGYPCCLSNMHQGWPKLVQNLYYATSDNGLAALVFAPSEVDVTVADGVNLHLEANTQYPFEEEIQFEFHPEKTVQFSFHLRVPAWCESPELMVNGEKQSFQVEKGIIKINRLWKEGDVVQYKLPMKVSTSRWYEKSVAIERGPLLYALKIKEDWREVKNEHWPNSFLEVFPASSWNYGIQKKTLDEMDFNFEKIKDVKGYPWNLENAPSKILTKGKVVPFWREYNGNHGKIPVATHPNRELGTEEEVIELVPYGCTTLRISQFPVVDVAVW